MALFCMFVSSLNTLHITTVSHKSNSRLSRHVAKKVPNKHVVKHGLDWTCKLWTELVKHGLVKHGLVKHGLVKHGLVKHGLVKHGLVKHIYGLDF